MACTKGKREGEGLAHHLLSVVWFFNSVGEELNCYYEWMCTHECICNGDLKIYRISRSCLKTNICPWLCCCCCWWSTFDLLSLCKMATSCDLSKTLTWGDLGCHDCASYFWMQYASLMFPFIFYKKWLNFCEKAIGSGWEFVV